MTEGTEASKVYADTAVAQRLTGRMADEFATFLLPHLQPGMSLLDAGCGPGSITLGLAEAVAPGSVVGVDIEPELVDRAIALAAEHGATNARFQVGDAYALPFPDATFDVVFAHTLLNHLDEPMRALREFRRVLKPGGLAAVRERDLSSLFIVEPPTPLMDEVRALLTRFIGRHGTLGNSRRLRGALIEAGFDHAEMAAVSEYGGSDATLLRHAHTIESIFRTPTFRRVAADNGWADEETIEQLIEGVRAWAQRPDAFLATISFSALGWVGADP